MKQADSLEVYLNPIRTAEESYSTLRKYGFEGKLPQAPTFFEDLSEVIFNTSDNWKIDKDFNSLSHIIEKRIDRFPVQMRDKSPDLLARKLYDAIGFAMLSRNAITSTSCQSTTQDSIASLALCRYS